MAFFCRTVSYEYSLNCCRCEAHLSRQTSATKLNQAKIALICQFQCVFNETCAIHICQRAIFNVIWLYFVEFADCVDNSFACNDKRKQPITAKIYRSLRINQWGSFLLLSSVAIHFYYIHDIFHEFLYSSFGWIAMLIRSNQVPNRNEKWTNQECNMLKNSYCEKNKE